MDSTGDVGPDPSGLVDELDTVVRFDEICVDKIEDVGDDDDDVVLDIGDDTDVALDDDDEVVVLDIGNDSDVALDDIDDDEPLVI
jgi:hypothetical protein